MLPHGGGVTAEMDKSAYLQEVFKMKTQSTQLLGVRIERQEVLRMTPWTLICATRWMDRTFAEAGHWEK